MTPNFLVNRTRNGRQGMQPTSPLIELLQALASGNCSSELWEHGAVAHYESADAEAVRIQLVRAAIEVGEWLWPSVPPSVAEKAKSLLLTSTRWGP